VVGSTAEAPDAILCVCVLFCAIRRMYFVISGSRGEIKGRKDERNRMQRYGIQQEESNSCERLSCRRSCASVPYGSINHGQIILIISLIKFKVQAQVILVEFTHQREPNLALKIDGARRTNLDLAAVERSKTSELKPP
jgi:hypothetical protein